MSSDTDACLPQQEDLIRLWLIIPKTTAPIEMARLRYAAIDESIYNRVGEYSRTSYLTCVIFNTAPGTAGKAPEATTALMAVPNPLELAQSSM